MAKNPTCDICNGGKSVMSYDSGGQFSQGKIEGINASFNFAISVSLTAAGEEKEVCDSCAKSICDAVTATVAKLKQPTVMRHNV